MGKNRQFLSKHVRNEVGSFVEPQGDQFLVSSAPIFPACAAPLPPATPC